MDIHSSKEKVFYCPICGNPREKRKDGGYCRRCATLTANINTKKRRKNVSNDIAHHLQELQILRKIYDGKPTTLIIREIINSQQYYITKFGEGVRVE